MYPLEYNTTKHKTCQKNILNNSNNSENLRSTAPGFCTNLFTAEDGVQDVLWTSALRRPERSGDLGPSGQGSLPLRKKRPRLLPESFLLYCGRWDLNSHDRIDHKILSLARLPVPTLPHLTIAFALRIIYNTLGENKCQQFFSSFPFFFNITFLIYAKVFSSPSFASITSNRCKRAAVSGCIMFPSFAAPLS